MILLSSVSDWLAAQQIVYPDSIVMIKDERSKLVGFVFPRQIAIDYYNLVEKLVPSYKEKIALLDAKINTNDRILGEKNNQIELLKSNLADERQKFEKLTGLQELYEKEIKYKKRWRMATLFLAGSTAILTALVIAK